MNSAGKFSLIIWLQLALLSFSINLFAQTSHLNSNSKKEFIELSATTLSNSMRFVGKTTPGAVSFFRGMHHKLMLDEPEFDVYFSVNADIVYDLHFKAKGESEFTNTWGVAFSPFGFMIIKDTTNPLSPFFRFHGGFIWFDQVFPNQKGLFINFTYEITTGAIVKLGDYLKLNASYTFYHFSNAEIAYTNPGMDNNIIMLGIIFPINHHDKQ